MTTNSLKEQLTILVNTCDAYEDLWYPFFTLLKRYWNNFDLHIILNTESKQFYFSGLNIQCVNCSKTYNYGKRMLNALNHIKTKYVLVMLDDFFIRTSVDVTKINTIIEWMNNDPKIAYFSCDCNHTYADWEINAYEGFKRLPPANDYILTLQAAVWRTSYFKKFWKPNVNPWEWEMYCNLQTVSYQSLKFYCPITHDNAFLNYGHQLYGDVWGVFRGKWVIHDVDSLFKKENIEVDYSKRGIYVPENTMCQPEQTPIKTFNDCCKYIKKYFKLKEFPKFFIYYLFFELSHLIKRTNKVNYFEYLKYNTRYEFLKKHHDQH